MEGSNCKIVTIPTGGQMHGNPHSLIMKRMNCALQSC